MTHLLVVSSDPKMHTALRPHKGHAHRVTAIENADSLSAAIAIYRPDIVLLDLPLEPDDNPLEVCKSLRAWSSIPLIFSASHVDVEAKVNALDAGADDYLVKPVEIEELLARVRAIQRRLTARPSSPTPTVNVGNVTVNFVQRKVWLNEQPVNLSHKEYELLKALVLAQGHPVSHRSLLQSMGGKQHINERTAIRFVIHRLRNKLGDDLNNPAYILTESGIGYRLNTSLSINTLP
jgi:two-component system, OmpR family, KDP operon response regulator KdpE